MNWRRKHARRRWCTNSCITGILVQKLKCNICVFALVRPLLPSNVSCTNDEKARMVALANISYPDSRDHREIVLGSTSESTTSQERKDTWNFSFDRVVSDVSYFTYTYQENIKNAVFAGTLFLRSRACLARTWVT
ncbi:hypothetical protein BGY98DRAFT_984788 [Russula aff. rugulosa BPL654]|nr:hypothetical protein BGY98DRAFT_984788 [Russula aff. rugulosa BPL654]